MTDHSSDFDVIIAGSGPGGCACAMALGGSGLRVALVDKASFPRDKTCGDAVSGKVMSALKAIDPDFTHEIRSRPEMLGTWGIRFVAPNTQPLDIPFKLTYDKTTDLPSGYVSKRVDFDNFLFQKASATEGVTVFSETKISDVESGPDGVSVQITGGQLRGKLVVGAEGAHSVVAKKLGGMKVEPDHYCGSVRAYYEGVGDMHPEQFIELHFLKDFLPGYFWIFPLPGNMANVGVGMLSSAISKEKIDLKAAFDHILHHEPSIAPRFTGAKRMGPLKGFGLPLGSKKRKISGDRFLLIGDAASLIDPFTGEGIGNAVVSARLAAGRIKEAFEADDFSGDFFSVYDERVYQKLWAELKMSHTLQRLLNFPWLFNFFANKASRNPEIRNMLTSMFVDMDIRKILKDPGFYFRLVFK